MSASTDSLVRSREEEDGIRGGGAVVAVAAAGDDSGRAPAVVAAMTTTRRVINGRRIASCKESSMAQQEYITVDIEPIVRSVKRREFVHITGALCF